MTVEVNTQVRIGHARMKSNVYVCGKGSAAKPNTAYKLVGTHCASLCSEQRWRARRALDSRGVASPMAHTCRVQPACGGVGGMAEGGQVTSSLLEGDASESRRFGRRSPKCKHIAGRQDHNLSLSLRGAR